jgi:hypothetical protein
MTRPARVSTKQLALSLNREARHRPAEHTREELVRALADLLLEALGGEVVEPTRRPGGCDESEDHA